MSKEQMTGEQALLYREVYIPAFVEKCGELGVEISDPETLNDALETTSLVKQTLQKQGTNRIKQANLTLKQALGVQEQEAVENNDERVKEAAAHLGRVQEIREALKGVSQ